MATSIDTNLIPHFSGDSDSKLWITQFQLMVTAKGLNEAKARTTLPLYLKDTALRWYISLDDDIKGDYDLLKESFQARFQPDPRTKWQRTAELYTVTQNQSTVEDYIARITTKTAELQLPDEQTFNIILNGLKPCIRQFVLQQNPGTIQELAQSAKLAQLTVVDNLSLQNSLVAAVNRIESKLQDLSVSVATHPQNSTYRQPTRNCYFCGRRASHPQTRCPAYGKKCNKCGKLNHFANVCRSMPRSRNE